MIGDGGTEKTRFLAGCPQPFVYDFDAGMQSAADFDVEYETFKDRPQGSNLQLPGFFDWGTSWSKFIDHLNTKTGKAISKGEFEHETLGVDSITTLTMACMNYVLKGSGKTAESNPEVQHWGMQLRLLENVMSQLAAWPVTFVVTAHIKRDENLVTGGVKEFLPLVTGQLAGRLGIYFDEVYYTEVKGKGPDRQVVFITEADSLYRQAKSRHNVPNRTPAKWSALEPYFRGTATSPKRGA